jgi:secreted PhoX family phosphatase
MKPIHRRNFLRASGAWSLGLMGLHQAARYSPLGAAALSPYGELQPDPNGWLDLPKDFRYVAFSRTGDTMSDGLLVPEAHDGMAAFAGPGGTTILVRNHELSASNEAPGAFANGPDSALKAKLYDSGANRWGRGGTTTIVFDTRTQQMRRHFLSLAGTVQNCAGGPTPWGSWITCEETTVTAEQGFGKPHGYNFEVPAKADGLVDPQPLRAMGRFVHEAVAVDPKTGIVYQTEDRADSLIYRFLPDRKGDLRTGRLQALVVTDKPSLDTRNLQPALLGRGEKLHVKWIDIQDVESPKDDLRMQGQSKGAARFARGEGMWHDRGTIWFICTSGGPAKKGQIFRYRPSAQEGRPGEERAPGVLDLFIEPNDESVFDNPDNITVAPWGDLYVCEDGPGDNFVLLVTPDGAIYPFAKNAHNNSELAGATFSPDGSTLFVNIQTPGVTLAITGPWNRSS